MSEIGEYQYSSYREYVGDRVFTDTGFVLEMLAGDDFVKFHSEEDAIEFTATGRKRKTMMR